MALDKQKILSELGSVFNQLQNADCGCMGKLFSDSGHGHNHCHGHGGGCMGNPLPTCGGCRRGTCAGHGCGAHHMSGGGDPFVSGGMDHNGSDGGMGMHGAGMGMRAGEPGMGAHCGSGRGMGMHAGPGMGMHGKGEIGMQGGGMCRGMPGMGGRNAQRMYAETYNYLNKNLMQPVMEEVYNELKSITPENTIGNNPLAANMGLPMNQGGGMCGMSASGGGHQMQNPGDMSHMGAQMVNMMLGSGKKGRPNMKPISGGVNPEPGMANMNPGSNAMNPCQPGLERPNMGQGNPEATMQNPVTQYVTAESMHAVNAQNGVMPQGNPMSGAISSAQGMNPAAQQMQNLNPKMQQNMGGAHPVQFQGKSPYGMHTAGIQKFKEMFPGTTQGLDFDPMAIAMQMNPAYHKQVAMNQMTKAMMNPGINQISKAMMQPATTGANAILNSGGQSNAVPQPQMSQPGQQNAVPIGQAVVYPGNNQQVYAVTDTNQQMPQQQMYQQQITQQEALQQPIPQQQIPLQQIPQTQMQQGRSQLQIDPNTGAPIMPQQGVVDPYRQVQATPTNNENSYNQEPQQLYYNTLGQPIQKLPRDFYQAPPIALPQTLGGYPAQYREGGVKNTISKTAIAPTIPLGRTASKSQLQHIYRQYKASHSQPNIRPPPPAYNTSPSLVQLNTTPMTVNPALTGNQQLQQIPVEKVGGDTIANDEQAKMEPPVTGQVGDAPPAQLQGGDTALAKEKIPDKPVPKARNGLQDKKFGHYLGRAAWSFHG